MLVNELINFATQYGTVQKKLLNEFEIPYALLDYNGKVLWVNEKFTEITGKTKNFHKSITSIFPGITRELIQQEQFVEDVNMVWQEHNFRIEMSKIYFEEMAENSVPVSSLNLLLIERMSFANVPTVPLAALLSIMT